MGISKNIGIFGISYIPRKTQKHSQRGVLQDRRCVESLRSCRDISWMLGILCIPRETQRSLYRKLPEDRQWAESLGRCQDDLGTFGVHHTPRENVGQIVLGSNTGPVPGRYKLLTWWVALCFSFGQRFVNVERQSASYSGTLELSWVVSKHSKYSICPQISQSLKGVAHGIRLAEIINYFLFYFI